MIAEKTGGPVLVVLPLGVRQEFRTDAHVLATGEHPAITDAQRPSRGGSRVAHLMLMRGDEVMFWRRSNQHAPWRPEAGL